MTLLLSPTRTAVPLGPAWAVLCGAIAAESWRWQSSTLLALAASVLIAEVLWSSWRAHLRTEWRAVLAQYPLPTRHGLWLALPYTKPSSPLGRALGRVQQAWQWVWTAPADKSSALIATLALPPVTLLLSALVGQRMLLLSLAAEALALVEWRARHRLRQAHVFQAAIEIVLPWLAGHATLAPITPMSLLLACSFGLTYQGALSLEGAQNTLGHERSWALFLFFAGQAVAASGLLFSATSHPTLIMASLGLLIAPQSLLLIHAGDAEKGSSYLRQAAPFVMISMLIAAWAA